MGHAVRRCVIEFMASSAGEIERTIDLAESALERIKALRHPATPHNFEVWYTYAGGSNTALNQAINTTINDNGTISELQIEETYLRYFSAARIGERIDKVGTQMAGEIEQVMAMIQASIGTADDYVVTGQVELADAAGNRGAVLDGHQPFVLAQVMADLAVHGQQQGAGLLDFVECAGERLFGNVGIVAEGQQDLALAFEFLHQVEFQFGAAGDLEDFEQRDQRDVVLHGAFGGRKMGDLVEQIFEPQ